jgi:mitochondrial cardiolipin hydrolase
MPAMPMTTLMPPLLTQLEATLQDGVLSDAERRDLTHALREATPPEEGLRQLRNRAFELVRTRLAGGGDQQALIKWLEGVVRAIDTGRQPTGVVHAQAFFSPGDACLRAIMAQLRAARQRADLCVFTLSDDRISSEILAAFQRGVAVRLITDNDKAYDAGSDVSELARRGVPVVVDQTPAHMHHKFAVFDGTWLLNGSYNWTRSAAQVNEENLVICNDPTLVRQFSDEFESLWRALQR